MSGKEYGRSLRARQTRGPVRWPLFRKVFYVYEEDDSMLIYYQMLRKYAREYGLRTSYIEAIIGHCFDHCIEHMLECEQRPYKIEVESILNIPAKEIDKAVSRWARRFDEWLYFMRSRLRNPRALITGENDHE